jgi:uncharacterized protein YndB with AHSA1/START domain
MATDQIKKQVFLNAKVSRVWRALTESKEFGAWFGMKLEGPFVAGEVMHGTIVPTQVDAEVAKMQKPHEGKRVKLVIDRIEPERLFSFKWHPFAIDPHYDYSKEPMTLITFTLEEAGDGTLLTITETGFDKIPIARRKQAVDANTGGWEKQTELIAKYLKSHVA